MSFASCETVAQLRHKSIIDQYTSWTGNSTSRIAGKEIENLVKEVEAND